MLAPPSAEMRSPAAGNGRARSQENFNAAESNATRPTTQAKASSADVEFVPGSIKGAILRIDEIKQELINAGVALKAGYISPQTALDWSEDFAPGCLGYIPPSSGLKVKRGAA